MRLPSAPAWQPFRPQPAKADEQNGHASRPVGLPRQRRRGMLALGVALAGLGILAGGLLLSSVSHRQAVLALAKAIPPGATITRDDLTTVMISSGSGLKTIPASQLAQVTGLTAATALDQGTLLVPSELTSTQVPAPGDQLVTVALKPSQLPARGLLPGDQVLVIATPGTQAAAAQLTADVPATVIAEAGPTQDGYDTVDLQVSAAAAPSVARQDSTGQIALIVTARRS